jgi:hypothetical protein
MQDAREKPHIFRVITSESGEKFPPLHPVRAFQKKPSFNIETEHLHSCQSITQRRVVMFGGLPSPFAVALVHASYQKNQASTNVTITVMGLDASKIQILSAHKTVAKS